MITRSKFSRFFSLALCICMVLTLLPAIPLVANAASSTVTVYFQNNWNWNNLKIYYWGSKTHTTPGWPGVGMTYHGTYNGKAYYKYNVPADVTGIIFSDNGNSKCTDITSGWYDGITYYMEYSGGQNVCKSFNICLDFPDLHNKGTISGYAATCTKDGLTNGVKCTRCDKVLTAQETIPALGHNFKNDVCTNCGTEGRVVYFQNNWEWSDVKLYYWKGEMNNQWPGEPVKYHGAAVAGDVTRYYSVMTVPADVDGFIINGTNNSNTGTNKQDQTVTITLKDWYDGITYYLGGYTTETDGHHVCEVDDFPICKNFADQHKFENNKCTRCGVTYCQLNGHVDVDGENEAAAEGEDACDRCGTELMDIFFKNNWNWSDVRLYYWYKDETVVPANPGLSMGWYGKNHGYDYYRMKVPTGIKGFIVSGYRDDNSGVREQTVDITTGWYDGATFYPSERSGETTCAVGAFEICIDFPQNHRYEAGSDFCKFCNYPDEVTVYFKDSRNWSGVNMYYWGSRNDPTELEFPGKSMELYDNDGTNNYYCLTIPADCDGIKFVNANNTEVKSADITSGWSEGITYAMIGNEGDQVESFQITDVFPCTYGHVEEILPAADPTCVDTGLTAGVKCSRCGETLEAQTVIPATGNHADGDKQDGRCDVCGCLMQDVYLAFTTASLEGNIAVNYFLLLSDAVLADENAYMQFTMADGEIIKIPVSQSKLIDGYDVFTCEVAAKEMTDIITSQFYYGGQPVLEHQYNVRAYAKHILKNSDNESAKNLMKAMVNYGAASQAYFGYHTDDLANTEVTEDPDYSNASISGFPVKRGQGTDLVKFRTASLILNSETTLRLFFSGKPTVTYNGKNLPIMQRGSYYYVDIVDISAKDLDEAVAVTVNDGTTDVIIEFSPMAYCQSVLEDTSGSFSTEMKNLAYALYLYNQAANAYFGDTVTPEGASLYNALHYLNGDTNGTKISGQVTSVTLGRSSQHREIVNGNAPSVLVTDQQETPATAYYVNNGSGYDVYVLSNDVIYAPKDCSKLFYLMSNVEAIETANFDVSRVENMLGMFTNCAKLENLELSDWDTSNVTNMQSMFYGCDSMTELNMAGWNVEKVENIRTFAFSCDSLETIDISGWNLASGCNALSAFSYNPVLVEINATGMKTTGITSAEAMFRDCTALTEVIGSGNWYLPNVTTTCSMFQNCTALKSVNVSRWNLSNLKNASWMFYCCSSLTTLEGVGQWKFENLQDVSYMFSRCISLKELDVANWNMSKVENFDCMFSFEKKAYPDMQLTTLDVSNWDTSSATSMASMFFGCCNLAELDVSGWQVGNVTSFYSMFRGRANSANSMRLTVLDVSDWDTGSAENMECMFQGCNKITELDLKNWNVEKVTCVSHMFADCNALETLDLSGWQTPSMLYMDAMFNDCSSLKTINVSSFNTINVLEFSQMFEGCSKLEKIEGLESWETGNGLCFAEMFSGCSALTELNLSSFDTRNANENFGYHYYTKDDEKYDDYECFEKMFNGLSSLTKLTLSENVTYDREKVTIENYKLRFPDPAAKEGYIAKWKNVDNGQTYLGSEIPEGVKATYEAYYEEIPTT